MANEPITDLILQTANGYYRRRIMAGMAVVLTDTALKVTDGGGSFTYPRADAASLPAPAPAQPSTGSQPILTVGPGQQYRLIRDAMSALADQAVSQGRDQMDWRGTIQALPVPSDPKYYEDDYVPYRKPFGLMNHPGDFTLEALPLFDAKGRRQLVYMPINVAKIEYGKAPFVVSGKFTLRGFRIDEKAPYGNVAAIRTEGDTVRLLVEDCELVNCGDGILGASHGGTVTLRRVLLDGNGGSGTTHNIYLGIHDEVLVEDMLSTNTMHGHLFKCRAKKTTIRRSRFLDGPTGASSYAIDICEGGILLIEDTLVHRGRNAENGPALAFYEEIRTALNPGGIVEPDGRPNSITLKNFTVVSETPTNSPFMGALLAWIRNNTPINASGIKVFGPGTRLRQVNNGTNTVPFPGGLAELPAMPKLDFSSPAFAARP